MRLHLPSSLRKSLLLAISTVAATLGSQTADAAVLFDGVGLQTYADFGQNCGRFVAGEVNAMLQAIRERDGGIVITYQSDAYTPYTIPLEQGMIDFSSASSTPVDAAVGYGFLATVSHNGVLNPTYTANEVGGQNAVHYSSIDFKRGTNFHMESVTDYKVSRLNKLVTDAQPSELYSGPNPAEELNGEYLYRTGSGAMELALIDADGVWRHTQELDIPYSFATGGIVVVEWAEPASHQSDHDGNFGIFHHVNPKVAEEIAAQPLPYRVRSGDSGSPSWVWNPDTMTYQYISAGQSGGQYFNQDRGDLLWSKYAMESCGERFQLGGDDHSITLSAVTQEEAEITGIGDNVDISTIPYSGTITYTDAIEGLQERKFIGIQQGKHTWLDLSPIKDQVNWFNYGNAYFNVSKYKTEDKEFSYADLFVTDNLIFEAGDGNTYNIVLDADVDLGIGYVQLSKAEGVTTANFKLQSTHLLESAGFAIDEGVSLELDMTADAERMVEWRKAGAGNLTITGSGNTNALLNVGGSGTVSLKRTGGGYAAYNVLASSGSTLVIKDLKQVYRDVTLGANGATLDLNGNNFEWNNSAAVDGSGFKSLHLLMEKDIVTNTANNAVTITITDPGTEAFVGAFRDTKEGAINVEYNGNSENPWVMNTVFTNLQNHDASSFAVNQGSVILQGINTIHGRQVMGKRPVNEFDWHYADAAMDVTVKSGAEFTLGSHARLTGDVTVENGGVFNMTEYTTHQYEYVEGGVKMDDTYLLRDYYGLHGNINLQGENSMFYVQFNPQHYYQDTDSQSVYTGKITGSGSMVVDTAGGSLKLTNAGNDFTGSKELFRGTLVASSKEALGDTTSGWEWTIYEAGVLQVTGSGVDELLPSIDGTSNGVLALTQDETGAAPNLSNHQDLIIGAVGDIQFGQKGTQQKLSTNDNNEWHLGGGGGDLYVNYMLNDADGVLVLGNQYTTGRVILTNSGNHFSSIELKGGVTLSYETTEALGGASLSLNYGNRILGDKQLINQLTTESNGVVLIDNMSAETIDLSTHGDLSLAADKATTLTGSINLGDNDTYRFGGGSGHLVLGTDLTDGPGGAKRNILVDAQFFTPAYADIEDYSDAGVVELTRVSQATGNVTVQGFDSTHIPDPDDPLYILSHFSTATLQLSVDDALVNAESILLKDGGFIDINGTKQTLNSLLNDYEDVFFGAYGVRDDSEDQSGELVLNVTKEAVEESLWGPIFCNFTVSTLTKTGDGELMMLNVNESSLFTIKDGTVYVYEVKALNSGGVTRVEGPGVLDVSELGEALDNKTIELNNGGTMLVGPDAISGSITAKEGTGTLDATGGTANLDATIGAARGATLELTNGSFNLRAAQNNTAGGTIDLQGGTLSLNNANGVSIGGTLQVSRNAMLNTTVSGTTLQLDCLKVENGVNLSIQGNNRSSVWNIHALEGSGNVTWQPGSNAEARLVLGGEGSFSGTLTVEGRTNPQGAPGLVLAHDLAAQHATISLQDNASMAVNTANARMAGLNGNASSAVYAYDSVTGATLTTTGAGTYTYSGTIGTSDAPMNIVMEGAGSQTYAGTVNAADVSALNGTLSLQGSNINIAGDVTVARGATLSVNNGLTLVSGQNLCSIGETGAAGVVNSAVTFSGGGLSFDASGLMENTAALKFNNGVTATGNVTVDFTNTSYLTANTTLTLTEGYSWNANKLTATGLDYLTAKFSTDGSLLKVSFTEKTGNRIWDGTASQHTWSTDKFGQGNALSSTDTAVFNDSAQNTNVQVVGEVSAAALLFDNSKEYTVNTTGDASLSVDKVNLQGSGDVTLGGGVYITGTADIAAGSTLVLKETSTLRSGSTVTGDGTLAVDADIAMGLDDKVTHIGSVELRGGTLVLSKSLSAGDLVVNEGATLAATTSSILDNNATVHSAGTITIEIVSKEETLSNAIAAGQGGAGTFVKVGGGTLYVAKSLVADTVRVEHGSLRTSNASIVPDFLATTKLLEVDSGATAYIGGNAYTIPDRPVATDMVVDGGTLELAIAQNTTRTISGDLTINSGKLQKVDGGLIFTGTTTLGNSIADQVTLAGNWGKAGTIFDGLVQGEGKVTLAKGNSVEKFTFNNGDNTFSGEIKATAGTQLVAGHKTALAQASNINLENNSTLVLATGEVDIKSLNGSGAVEFSAADDSSSTTLNITDGGTFAGAVEGNISISKSGSGAFALTGESSQFNGDLYVKEGTMKLEDKALGMLGSASSVTVKSGAALQLGGAANVVGPMDIQGSLSMGGDISSRDSVQLAATSHLAGGSHTLEANSLVIDGQYGTNVVAGDSQTLSSGDVLTAFGDSSKTITLQAGTEAAVYVVNNVQNVTLTGTSLTINLSGVEQPQPGQWMGITLGDTASMDTGLLVECVIGDGQKMQGYYLSSSSGSSDYVYFQMEGVVIQDLIWDHSSNTNWSTIDANWHTAEAPATHVPFSQEANVTFESETCTANLTENISAGAVTLKSGANVTINGAGHSLTTGEIAGSGATLKLANSAGTYTMNGRVELSALDVGNATTVIAGGEGSLGTIRMTGNSATTLKFSAKDGTDNSYTFDTLSMSFDSGSAGGPKWLVVDEGVTVHGTGHNIGSQSNATINNSWGINGGGLEVNGTLTTDGVISMDSGSNLSVIRGSGQINTTGLNISNGSSTTIQGGVKVNITSDTGIYKRDGGASTLNLADTTLQAKTVNWEIKNSVNNVNLTNSETGTTFEAAANRTITVSKAMGGSGKLVKAGDGTLTLTAANTYSGGTTVNAGTLVASNASALGSGAVTLNGGTLDLATAVTTGAFTMNSGTLALDGENWLRSTDAISLTGGTLDLTGMSITSGRSYTLATGTGVYLDSAVTFTLGQGLHEQYKLTANDTSLMLTFIQPAPAGALIWDNASGNGQWDGSSLNWHADGAQAGSSAFTPNSDVYFDFASNNQTVTLAENITAGMVEIQGGVKVTIADGNNKTLFGTLTGSGTYALASDDKTLPGNLVLAPDSWTGSVEVSGNVGERTCSFNGLSTANSTVLMSGVRFWWRPDAGTEQTANFLLNDSFKDNGQSGNGNTAAMQINGANDGGNYYFTGTFSGAGDMAYTQAGSDIRNSKFYLRGDLSAWTGNFVNYNGNAEKHPSLYLDGAGDVVMGGGIIQQGSGGLDVYLGGNSTDSVTVNGAVDGKNGTLKLNVKADARFNGTVNATGGMAVDSEKTAVFMKNATLGALSGDGVVTYAGDSAGTIALNGSTEQFNGALLNVSDEDLSISFGTSATSLKMEIGAYGDGDVNLSMAHADYNMYGAQYVNNIAHDVNMTLEVRDSGNLTATGTVRTGRLVVGETASENGAVFTLSGAGAMLNKADGSHEYNAQVQGYGTFKVADGATQTLSAKLDLFHGTFAADGEGSVLTLSGEPASDIKMSSANSGVIRLTRAYTLGDGVAVDGGTIRVDNGLVVNGSVDLSEGTLNQQGGTITVNGDKGLTLGQAHITSAIANSGTVTFTQDITATGLQETSVNVRVGADGEITLDDNYFHGTRSVSAIQVVNGGTVATEGRRAVTQGSEEYTLMQDGKAYGETLEDAVEYGLFYQYEAGSTLDSSIITATAEAHGSGFFGVAVEVNNATLNVNSEVALVEVTDANVINTENAGNIGYLQVAGGTNTLTGSVAGFMESVVFQSDTASSLRMQNADASSYTLNTGAVDFRSEQVTVSAAASEGEEEGYDYFDLDNDRYTVESHKMVKVENGNVTVNNHIKTDTVSTGETTGSLTLANGVDAEALNEVIAASGDVTFLNMAAENKTAQGSQTVVSLDKLEIGEGKTVSFYESSAPVNVGELAEEASVTVVGTLTAGTGAHLNADLEMMAGSTLDVSADGGMQGLIMGSTVTLNSGSMLNVDGVDANEFLRGYLNTNEYYVLFSSVDSFVFNGQEQGNLGIRSWQDYDMDAHSIYDNLASGTYAVVYTMNNTKGSNVGMIALTLVPEPATSTLSLLALAALAARRRRKS